MGHLRRAGTRGLAAGLGRVSAAAAHPRGGGWREREFLGMGAPRGKQERGEGFCAPPRALCALPRQGLCQGVQKGRVRGGTARIWRGNCPDPSPGPVAPATGSREASAPKGTRPGGSDPSPKQHKQGGAEPPAEPNLSPAEGKKQQTRRKPLPQKEQVVRRWSETDRLDRARGTERGLPGGPRGGVPAASPEVSRAWPCLELLQSVGGKFRASGREPRRGGWSCRRPRP